MGYEFKSEKNIEEKDKYVICFREPLKFDFNDDDVKLTLYQVREEKNKSLFFDSIEEEQKFISNRTNTNYFQAVTLEYLGDFAGEKNVLYRLNRVYRIGPDYEFLIPCGNYGHKVLNIEKSKKKNKYVWEFRFGGLKNEYEAIYNYLQSVKENEKSSIRNEIDWSKEELWTIDEGHDYDKIGPHNRMVLQKNPRYNGTVRKK